MFLPVNIDECIGVECIHGICEDGINEFICNCTAGYNGTYCEGI